MSASDRRSLASPIGAETSRRHLETLIAGAEKHARDRDFETAVATLELALDLDPSSPHARELLTAIRRTLVEEEPKALEIERLLTQAEACLEQSEIGQAQVIAAQVWALDPGNQDALTLLEKLDGTEQPASGWSWEPSAETSEGDDPEGRRLIEEVDRLLLRPLDRPTEPIEAKVLVAEPDRKPQPPTAPQAREVDPDGRGEPASPSPPPERPSAERATIRRPVQPDPETSARPGVTGKETPGRRRTPPRISRHDEPLDGRPPEPAGRSRHVLLIAAAAVLAAVALFFFGRSEDELAAGLRAVELGQLYSRVGPSAVEYFDVLHDRDPSSAETRQLGSAITEKARPELERTLESFRFDADSEVDLRRWHALAAALSKIDPSDRDALFAQAFTEAQIALAEGDFAAALVTLEGLKSESPHWDFLVSAAIGRAYGVPASPYRNPERAARFLRESLEGDPRFIRPLLEMARLSRDEANWKRAETYLQRAIQVDPKSPRLLRELGFVLGMQREWERARDAYARSIEHETDEAENAIVRRRLKSLGR